MICILFITLMLRFYFKVNRISSTNAFFYEWFITSHVCNSSSYCSEKEIVYNVIISYFIMTYLIMPSSYMNANVGHTDYEKENYDKL